ncbi:UNVERIFIED_CONTAM: hypothetical protein PYX00_006643 [Menopon gallinae]|uniref:Uncharacterized protein n=1 Tax=Menopon gallinae TaxID=328185 RepID=A0AAW2HXW4_9NEOP
MDEDYIVDRGIHYRFLASAATFLNRIQSPSLRCHMNLHSADVLGRTNRQLYVKKNKRTIVCQHCHTPWKYGDFALRVLPKAKLGKKMRKILCKKRNDKPLSPIQKKLADMHHGNTVVLKCGTCEKSTRLKTFWNLMPEQMETSEVTDISQNVKKKKKKKNKYSGLNPAVMKTLHPSNEDESDVIYLDENSVSDNDCPPPKKRKKNKDDVSNILGKKKLRKPKKT